jgi:hypothetical protein
MYFHVGLHQPSDCQHFERSFVSINRIRQRKAKFSVNKWIMDSGAFTEISSHGEYRTEPEEYAREAARWEGNGSLLCIVSQDYMCEPFILKKTGMTVREHQEKTVERYVRIVAASPVSVMPVLQGYQLADYLNHIDDYGTRGLLSPGMRIGVGSVCKRNSNVEEIEDILFAIKEKAPYLRLHGFGLKTTALRSEAVWAMLYSADSMAWSYSARMQGRNANDWREAKVFEESILTQRRSGKVMTERRPVRKQLELAW